MSEHTTSVFAHLKNGTASTDGEEKRRKQREGVRSADSSGTMSHHSMSSASTPPRVRQLELNNALDRQHAKVRHRRGEASETQVVTDSDDSAETRERKRVKLQRRQ